MDKALFTLVVILASTAPLEIILNYAPDAAPYHTLLWLGIYLLCAIRLLTQRGAYALSWLLRFRLPLIILLAGASLTTVFSVDPALSANRLVHLLGTSLIAIHSGFALSLRALTRILFLTLLFLIAASIVAVFTLPDLALENYDGLPVWKGVLDNKNTLGFWAATGALACIAGVAMAQTIPARAGYLLALPLMIITLYFSRSAGSIIAFMLATATMCLFGITTRLQLPRSAVLMIAGLIMILLSVLFATIDIAELTGRSSDLTGRSEVWQQVWQLIQQRPLTGYGYGTLWHPTEDTIWIQQEFTDFTWVVFHAHNGFLQTASEIGLPLAVLGVLFALLTLLDIIHSHHHRPSNSTLFVLGLIVAYLVTNYSEARFMLSRELFWIVFLTLPIAAMQTRVMPVTPVDTNLDTAPRPRRTHQLVPVSTPGHAKQPVAVSIVNTHGNSHSTLQRRTAQKQLRRMRRKSLPTRLPKRLPHKPFQLTSASVPKLPL